MRHGNLIFKARSSVCVVKTRFELLLLCALALTNSSPDPSLTIHGLFGIRRSCGTSTSAVRKALNPGVTLKASSTVLSRVELVESDRSVANRRFIIEAPVLIRNRFVSYPTAYTWWTFHTIQFSNRSRG